MPHTVPNRPTNGAVEPTVARTARPPVRFELIASTARFTDIVIHEDRSICSTIVPSWCELAETPRSAMYQNGPPFLSVPTPSFTEAAAQNDLSAFFDSPNSFCCSMSFTTMMYHVEADMITRMISV